VHAPESLGRIKKPTGRVTFIGSALTVSSDGTSFGEPPLVCVRADHDGRGTMSDDDWFERAFRGSDSDDPAAERGVEEADAETDGDPPTVDDEDDEGDEGDEGDGSPFDRGFASAFEDAPDPGGAGGFGELGDPDEPAEPPGAAGPQPGGFTDEDAVGSALPRIDLGVEGLDDMILGGVPQRSLITAIGSAGTGKTTFALQFLHRALDQGGRAVYLTLEESSERILDTADEKGWAFGEYAADGRLAVVHFDPIEMANSLANIRSDLPQLIDDFGADRLVLDSVSLLEMMYDDASTRRSEVYQFSRSLKRAGVTTLVTSEASSDDPYSSRYGIIEYLADAVFVLQYVRPSDFQETRLAVEIQKIRDANHSREMKPYEITNEGLEVYRQANIF
jgi:KaiC domain protein